jgi:3-methyladenine DNA glycosylase AlkD
MSKNRSIGRMMNCDEVLKKLESMGNPSAEAGMARYGIRARRVFGVSVPKLRALAKSIGKSHELALELFDAGIHDAKVLAALVDDPAKVTKKQMDSWAKRSENWGDCDSCCCCLFDRTPHAYVMVAKWSKSKHEFVKRAAFSMIAGLASHDKAAPDAKLAAFLPIIKRESTDERNFVKKAVNWALRGIGKRNKKLNKLAIKTAEEIARLDSRSARWIAADALRELKSEGVQRRLKK